MALRIRRGTDAQRSGQVFENGEIVWTIDGQQLWVGDGITAGGVPVISDKVAGYGLTYNAMDQVLEVAGLNADDLTNGVNNKFFDPVLAQDAAASLFTTGTHTNIEFQYDDVEQKINATVTLDGIGITAVSDDTTPTLGGNLSLNGFDVTGAGNINITGNIDADGTITSTGDIKLGGKLLSDLPTEPNPNPDRLSRPVYIGEAATPATVKVVSDKNLLVLQGLTDGTTTSSARFLMSRGTLGAKASLQPGDPAIFLEGFGWDGTDNRFTGALVVAVDPDGTVGGGITPGAVGLIASDATGNPTTAIFNSKGVFNAPIFKASGYATGSLPMSPEEGWIVFDSTTKEFKGWNGTSWSVLG